MSVISDCVDLHVHSTASDGSLSPRQLIELARKLGLRALSITDHDTLEGVIDALDHPPHQLPEIVSGVEMSADVPFGGMHILGYLVHLGKSPLQAVLRRLQEGRQERNRKIIARLRHLGVEITYDEVLRASREGQTGRPHFASVLMQKGYVRSFHEAFSRYLAKGRPAYAERFRPQVSDAIDAIRAAGGVAVLAHPFTLETGDERNFEGELKRLCDKGLQGMEVYYPDHGPGQVARYERLARTYGLVATGGTDFHGEAKPGIHMGVGKGDLRISYRVLEALKGCLP
jgi:predicted metal-dependent phosphoesterase TrpH